MKRKVDNIFNYNNENKELNRMPVNLSFSYHDETTNNDLINKHKLLPEIIEANQNNLTVETSTLSISSTILQHEESLEHISNIESDEAELNNVKILNKIEQKNHNHKFLINVNFLFNFLFLF